MKALILRNDTDAAIATARALIDKGFQVLCVETLTVAHSLIRVDTIDLLVMDERVEGQLTHAIALSGERRNPYLSAIFLTDRSSAETDDLYALIPSLYALVGAETAPELLGKLALSSVSNVEEAIARVALHAAMEQAEEDAVVGEIEEESNDILILEAASAIVADNDDDCFEAPYADVAIAFPALAEIASARRPTLEKLEDVVMDEVAELFRSRPLSQLLQPTPALAAQVAYGEV